VPDDPGSEDRAMIERVAAVWKRRSIVMTLVRRDLRVRYSRSVLGYVWTILDPLLMASVYFVVFTFVFKAQRVADTPYFLYLLSGLLCWQWFSSSMTDTTKSLIQEARLLRSTNLPREVWVVRVVVAKGVEYVLSLPVLIAFVIYYVAVGAAELDWELVFFPLGAVIQFFLLIGIGLVLAPVTVLATDVQRVVRIFLRFFFYLSPVLYGTFAVPDPMKPLLALNPLNGILSLYRGGLFERGIAWVDVGVSAGITVAFLLVGLRLFARLERPVLKEI
jgi:ABC-2 type transport system permease protein